LSTVFAKVLGNGFRGQGRYFRGQDLNIQKIVEFIRKPCLSAKRKEWAEK